MFICLIVIEATSFQAHAADYFVSQETGHDANPGSTSAPFKTLMQAHNQAAPGDTVFVMNGVYKDASGGPPLAITRSGTEMAWISYRNYPGHYPRIEFRTWAGISLSNVAYVEIKGFEIVGDLQNIDFTFAKSQKQQSVNETNGVGIDIDKPWLKPDGYNHHIRIIGNKIHDIPGSGISSIGSDYLYIENNLIYRTGWYAKWGMSGVSSYQPRDTDNRQDIYRHVIRGNVSHSNYNYFECFCANYEKVTDGNGIIVDDGQHTQGDRSNAYTGRILIANNVTYNNGARGINVNLTDNVDVFNNTAWGNMHHPELLGGQITVGGSNNVRVFNNIAHSGSEDQSIESWGENKGNEYGHNLHSGGLESSAAARSPNDIYGKNPLLFEVPVFKDFGAPPQSFGLFDNTDYHDNADFRLSKASPARKAGRVLDVVGTDINGLTRPQESIDIGAYEWQP